MKKIGLALAVLAGLGSWQPGWAADAAKLTFAHSGAPGTLYDVCVKEFVRRLDQALPPGAVSVEIEGDSRLGDNTAVIARIMSGEVTFGLPSTVMSSLSETFGIFDLPFLIRDRGQVRRISQALLEPVLQPEMQKHGLRILAVWENGFRQITNNVRPIRRPEDLKGLKLRVPPGMWRAKVFRALGAEPVTMGLREVYGALQSGKIDGQENPLSQIKGGRFNEVQRFLTLSDHTYTPAYLVVSEHHFGKLPPDVQQIIERTATGMQDWVYENAVRIESELVDRLGTQMQSNQVDSAAFIAASGPIYREFVTTVPGGAKLVAIVRELADPAGASR